MAILTKTEKYVAHTYAKYFGRAADADTIKEYGLKENGKAEKASVILKNIIAAADAEKTGLDTTEFVNNAFQNLFGRDASTKEMNKYSKVVEKGKNLPINSIYKSVVKADKDVYNNKLEVAAKYAELGGKGDFDLSKISKGNLIKDIKTVTKLDDLLAKYEALADNSGVPSSFDGKTFVLTTGVDTGKAFVGTAKDDSFIASDVLVGTTMTPTWTVADTIDGGKGIDRLKIVTEGAVGTTDFENNTMKSIEIVDINVTGTNDIELDTTEPGNVAENFKDVTDLIANAKDGNVELTVNEKTNVTATTKESAKTITVTGGKVVNATADNGVVKIYGDDLTTVTVKGGATASTVENTVDGAGVAGETLKSVTLENMGTTTALSATVKGNAIDTLTLKNQTKATLTTTITNDKSTALTVNLNNVNSTTASDVTAGAKAETVTINSNGTKDNKLEIKAATGTTTLKTLNITGDATFTLAGTTPTTIKDIVSTNTKGVTITDALAKDVKFTGGTGADTVKLTANFEKAINMGAGDDTVVYAAAGTGGSVDAGAGKDTISIDTTSLANIASDGTGIFNSTFKNFEVLKVTDATAADVVIDVEKINNVSTVVIASAALTGDSEINNLANNSTVKFIASAANTLTANVKNSAGSKTDVLNVELEGSATVKAGTLTVNSVETINIISDDAVTTTPAGVVHELILKADTATSIVVTGDAGVDLSSSTAAKVTNFDASAVTAGIVTFTSSNDKVGEVVTIKGGAGNDVLTGDANTNDTIIGGAGNDTLVYTGRADTFTGGAGNDTFKINAEGTKALHLTITDLTKGDIIDITGVSSGTTAATFVKEKVALGATATFDDYLDSAASGNGGTNSIATWFQFEGNTYLVNDNDAGATFEEGTDAVIKITGLVDLSTADYSATATANTLTIA